MGYDAGRGYSSDVLAVWLDVIAKSASPRLSGILDLGCGPGRFSAPPAEHFPARVAAFDPSETMLAQASANRARSL